MHWNGEIHIESIQGRYDVIKIFWSWELQYEIFNVESTSLERSFQEKQFDKKSFCPIIFLKEFMTNTILILNFTKKVNFFLNLTPKPNESKKSSN